MHTHIIRVPVANHRKCSAADNYCETRACTQFLSKPRFGTHMCVYPSSRCIGGHLECVQFETGVTRPNGVCVFVFILNGLGCRRVPGVREHAI
jgi:hypothetical protein